MTFDPVHPGHLNIIKTLSEKFDKVIVVPTTVRLKAFKKNEQMFSFNERFEMLKDKCKQFSNVEVSDVERNVDDSWRFIDTLRTLTSGHLMTELEHYYVAIGADNFQRFKEWADWEEILKIAHLVVFGRPGYVADFPDIEHEFIEMNMDVSSTEVRERMRKTIEQDFDEMIDDMTWAKEYFEDGYDEDLTDVAAE